MHAHTHKHIYTFWGAYFENMRSSLIAQLVNHLPAMQETWVRFLGGEDPLEEGMT